MVGIKRALLFAKLLSILECYQTPFTIQLLIMLKIYIDKSVPEQGKCVTYKASDGWWDGLGYTNSGGEETFDPANEDDKCLDTINYLPTEKKKVKKKTTKKQRFPITSTQFITLFIEFFFGVFKNNLSHYATFKSIIVFW